MNQLDIQYCWQNTLVFFQDVLTHVENNMEEHPEYNILESMLKVLCLFMTKNEYENNVNMVGFCIMCINYNKIVGCGFKKSDKSSPFFYQGCFIS